MRLTHTEFICSQCGQIKNHPKDSISTGYGRDKDNNKVCFSCCGINDAKKLENSKIGQRHTLYFTGKALVNWPSSLSIPIGYVRKGRHYIAGHSYIIWL